MSWYFVTSLDQCTVAKFEPCSPAHLISLGMNLELPGVALRVAARTNCTLLEAALSKGAYRLTLEELKDLASLKQLDIAGNVDAKLLSSCWWMILTPTWTRLRRPRRWRTST